MVDLSIINAQYWPLINKYPLLQMKYKNDENWIVGEIHFLANFNGKMIEDRYEIRIIIPNDYPVTIPSAYETGNKIAQDFHKFYSGKLCLGSPIAVRLKFSNDPTLLGFVDNCLIPYLYAYSCLMEFGYLPYGDLSHGWSGQLEYYKWLFKTNDVYVILHYLHFLSNGKYIASSRCPCGSGKKIKKCHSALIKKLLSLQIREEFIRDYQMLLSKSKNLNC